jgi:DNA replication protein DnaC
MSTLPQKLEQLSLTTMSHHLDQTIADAATNNLSFPATLERLADLELEARRRRSIERRVKMSRLQAQHSIDANVGFRLRQYPKPRTVAASPAPKDLH